MAVSKALERLRRIRDLEEEQRRLALESALGELDGLNRARVDAGARERRGRALVCTAVQSGEVADRRAGHLEAETARRFSRILARHIAATETAAVRLREEFLEKRVERRQAEALVEESEAQEAAKSERRGQQAIDDWYGSRKHRKQAEKGHADAV